METDINFFGWGGEDFSFAELEMLLKYPGGDFSLSYSLSVNRLKVFLIMSVLCYLHLQYTWK